MPTTIYAMPERPDTAGLPTAPAADGGWLQAAWDLITGIPTGAWYTLAGVIVAVGLIASIRITTTRKNPRGLKGDKFLTFLAAGVSTSVVATGMWKFFGDVLHITNPVARGALFAVFEIAMLASAFRSRRFRLDRAAKRDANPEYADRRIDVDGLAVWVLALVSGFFAAADEHTTTAKAVRVVVPLLAAWMWERGLAGELMQFTRTGKRLNLRLTPERVLVWLGIAEPSSRGIGEVARRRRIARFARTAFRLHLLTEQPGKASRFREMRIGWLRWRLRRQTESGNEHLNLAGDQAALHDVRMQIALLYGAEEGTSRDAVRELTPLKPVKRLEIAAEPFDVTGHGGGHPADTGQDMATGQAPDISASAEPDTTTGQLTDTPADIAPDIDRTPVTDTVRTSGPDTATDASTDTRTDASEDTATDVLTDTRPDTQTSRTAPARRTPRRTSHRTPKWTKEQLKAFKLRDNDQDMTYPMIAREVGVSEKTVSRWFKAREAAEAADLSPAAPVIGPDILTPIPEPKPPVTAGINGHHPTNTEEIR